MQFYKQKFTDPLKKLVKEYCQNVEIFDEKKDEVEKSSIKLQSYWKMFRIRSEYLKFQLAACLLQKFFRGVLAKLLVKRCKEALRNKQNERFFSNQAILIQKVFRGFYKRKYYHEFSARKRYLQYLYKQNEDFYKKLIENEKLEISQKNIVDEQFAHLELNRLSLNLHHLTSTKNIPGVYKTRTMERAFNIGVETHIQINFHQNYQSIKNAQMNRYKEQNEIEENDIQNGNYSKSQSLGNLQFLRKRTFNKSNGQMKLTSIK